ncbi:MAG: YIP1 family protein [Pseudomonadota bacterium]
MPAFSNSSASSLLQPGLRPLRSVWLAPGRTVARIAHENPAYALHTLAVLSAFAPRAFELVPNSLSQTPSTFQLSLIPHPLDHLLLLYLGAYLLCALGAMFGGKAGPSATRVAIAWSFVPGIVLVAVNLIAALVSAALGLQVELEYYGFDDETHALAVVSVLVPIELALMIWSQVILVRGLAAVNDFSNLKALATALLGWLLIHALTLLGWISLLRNALPDLAHAGGIFQGALNAFQR